jgi:LPXTG-motif cell wall-anchored protein
MIIAACASLLLVSGTAAAQGPDTQHLTFVTFSGPVSLPGVTLPAGTYAFKLFDSQVNRNIVQVFDRDQTKIFATIIAIPAQRDKPADETVITFRESPANMAPAVRYWYYPGETTGQEFAYPKAQAMQIANAARESVLSIETESADAEAMKSGNIGRVDPGAPATPNPQETPQAPRAEAPAQPAPTPQAEPAQPATPAPSAPAAAAPAAPAHRDMQSPAAPAAPSQAPQGTSGRSERQLPQTGSELPLVGLAGLLALAGAGGVRMLRRVRA